MMLAGFLFLLLLTGGSTCNDSELYDDQQKFNHSVEKIDHDDYSACSYEDLLDYLNLTNKKSIMARPVKDHRKITLVHLQMSIYSIQDVSEIDQTFVSYVRIFMFWINEHITWHKRDFCGLEHVIFPTEVLWKPDITIEEMTEKDKAPTIPYLTIYWNGCIRFRKTQTLVSSCMMQVYKFPFDIQRCTLSLKSAVYSDGELKLEVINRSSDFTGWSQKGMRSEWQLISMTVEHKSVNYLGFNQSMIVYTITMRRRSVLYIINFILPLLLLFCLDLSSFLISDSGGEKLSFKVTVLLAVTVMQLILNEILPSSSDKIPLVVIYCIGIFGLMMLSLMETILVMYLMEKDSASQDKEADKDQSLTEDCGDKRGKISFHNCCREVKKWTHCACDCDVSADEPSSELTSVAKEGSSSRLMEESSALDELRKVVKMQAVLLNSRKEKGKSGYWARLAKAINKVFSIFYVTAAILFFVFIFSQWIFAVDE